MAGKAPLPLSIPLKKVAPYPWDDSALNPVGLLARPLSASVSLSAQWLPFRFWWGPRLECSDTLAADHLI